MKKYKAASFLTFVIGLLLGGLIVGYFANKAMSTITQAENLLAHNDPWRALAEYDKVHQYWPLYQGSDYFNQYKSQLAALKSAPNVIVYFKANASDQDIQSFITKVRSMSGVKEVKYISKQDALKIYRDRNKNNPNLVKIVTADILPASIEVHTESDTATSTILNLARQQSFVESAAGGRSF